jgi:hypothetical protein
LYARGNSIIVGVSFEAKKRDVRALERKAENDVKKKIRAIQYGWPHRRIHCAAERKSRPLKLSAPLTRTRQNRTRPGEVVGATDAPWGVAISADAKEVLEQNADVVMHRRRRHCKSDGPVARVPEAESCIVSTCEELSYPFARIRSCAKSAAAKEWGVALVGTE